MTKLLLYLLAFLAAVLLCLHLWPIPTFLVMFACGIMQAPVSLAFDVFMARDRTKQP